MTEQDPALSLLGPSSLSAYLDRLGVQRPTAIDLATLCTLQAAHLRAIPFHNLALLAAAGSHPGLPSVDAAVEGAVSGHGGTCHVLSPPFAVLLRSLGFDAHLAAATIGAPGDHLVVIVHLEGQRWLCDVANGHPYLKPFPLDRSNDLEESLDEQTAYGWRFRIEPVSLPVSAGATHRVLRLLPDGTWKVVYTLDPQMVAYSMFERIIVDHHTRIGFGPFLTGLRVVRMTPERLLCLRDCWLERYGVGPVGRRFLPSARAVGEVLTQLFGLGSLPVQAALRTIESQTQRWWFTSSDENLEIVPTQNPPALRLLVSVGLMDRPGGLWELGQGLLRDGLGSQERQPGAGILAFDNSTDPSCVRDNFAAAVALSAAGLPTQLGSEAIVRNVHQKLRSAGLCADSRESASVGIATSRMVQVGLLANHFAHPSSLAGRPPLPHPNDSYGPVAVWMLDDDLRLERIEASAQGLLSHPLNSLRSTLNQIYREHPEISVLIGGNTGCPPIPGFCFLYLQIFDLIEHIDSAQRQNPNAPYYPHTNPRHLPDYYYDTSDLGTSHLGIPFDWEPDVTADRLSVREALLAHLRAFSSVLHGQPATRLLVHQPDLPMIPTTARGGNAVFFDLDALFAAPYLALRLTQDVVSRRGDTVWAHLAANVSGVSVYQAPFPVHHYRKPQDGSSPMLSSEIPKLRQFLLSQIGGTVLSRLVASQLRGRCLNPLTLLEQRVAQVRTAFASAMAQITRFEVARYGERTDVWWASSAEDSIRIELARVSGTLSILRTGVLSCEVATTTEIEMAAQNLSVAMSRLSAIEQSWRSLWT